MVVYVGKGPGGGQRSAKAPKHRSAEPSLEAMWAELSIMLAQILYMLSSPMEAIGTLKLESIGAHKSCESMPISIAIGTPPAWEQGYYFMLNLVQVTDELAIYVSDQVTEFGLPNEKMFIIGHRPYWYACEGTFADGDQGIRQAVFRTCERFWEPGLHCWQTNKDVHTETKDKYADGKWMEGRWDDSMECLTRCGKDETSVETDEVQG